VQNTTHAPSPPDRRKISDADLHGSLTVKILAEDVRASLDALAGLEQGRVDGERGEPISPSVIERGCAVINAMDALGNVARTVTPTEQGGVTFFWPDTENQLSIEVEPDGTLYVHTVDLESGTFMDGRISSDVNNLDGALRSWLAI
jgi:hypothetical protein